VEELRKKERQDETQFTTAQQWKSSGKRKDRMKLSSPQKKGVHFYLTFTPSTLLINGPY
jgi:hypothetical protein